MERGKLFCLAMVVWGSSPVLVNAAEPATQPAVEISNTAVLPPPMPTTAPIPDVGTNDDGKQHRGERARLGPRFMKPYGAKELSDTMQFMQTHSIERFRFIEALPDGERKTGIQNFAVLAYLSWMRLLKDNPQLYSVVMKRVAVEDDIFGLVGQLRVAQLHSESADKLQAINSQLHDKVESLVDIGIKERQLRLDSLSRTIKEEQQKLDADSSDKKALVDKRLETILSDEKALMPTAPSGVNGPGRGRGMHSPDEGRSPNP